MTLGRVALGFLAVTALFLAFAWVAGRRERRNAAIAAAEALALTLLGALWFGSLGSGGWVLVFLLVGVLASGMGVRATPRGGGGSSALSASVTVVVAIRYVLAGGLLYLVMG